MMDLKQIRREYLQGGLRRDDMAETPLEQFSSWMREVVEMDIIDPTAMVLSTASLDGDISQRIVLLKDFDEQGFVFYSNYDSRKAVDMAANNRVGLHFPWHALERQVIVSGEVDKVSEQESLDYFHSRPRESQLAAWASAQSRPVSDRKTLEEQFEQVSRRFEGADIPLPDFWGGYRVRPLRVEFWQGGKHRLHDRFQYTLEQQGTWRLERLSP